MSKQAAFSKFTPEASPEDVTLDMAEFWDTLSGWLMRHGDVDHRLTFVFACILIVAEDLDNAFGAFETKMTTLGWSDTLDTSEPDKFGDRATVELANTPLWASYLANVYRSMTAIMDRSPDEPHTRQMLASRIDLVISTTTEKLLTHVDTHGLNAPAKELYYA